MNMMNKKTYIHPECCITKILGSNLMISASGGNGDVNLTYDSQEEGNAGDEGLSRRNNSWDDE